VAAVDRKYQNRLQELGFERRQRTALSAITFGAAARFVNGRRSLKLFLEQVEYNGRRLAKMNLPPSDIVEALAEYDQVLDSVLAQLLPGEHQNFQWARQQLQFCAILTLNKAYYQVRETEAEAFYELFRAELDARSLDDLLLGSLSVLTRFCGAQQAHVYLLDDDGIHWTLKASARAKGRRVWVKPGRGRRITLSAARKRQARLARCVHSGRRPWPLPMDETWQKTFASAWSVPMISGDGVTGVMQFAFDKRYEWLPREQELLEAAAERCMAAADKARLVEDLASREEQIRRLAEHMLHIEEVERRRISRELHDEAGQSLLYIRLQLEMLEKAMNGAGNELREQVENVREVTEHTILEMRRLIAALSPAVLEQLGLAAALRQLVSRFRKLDHFRVRLSLSQLDHLPKRTETIVYRLVQECCNNIAKHSQAANVNISLTSADGLLRLNVEDDGIGFNVTKALAQRNSFGLAGMRERVTLLGGSFEIDSKPAANTRKGRSGTRIVAELPIP
jgi:signal transduction histidine kinase